MSSTVSKSDSKGCVRNVPDNEKVDLRLEIRKLKRLARKAVLITSIACFAAMVMGITLYLHLLSRQHPEEHDAAHCSICQQLLIAPGKFITEPELIILDHSPRTDTVEFQSQSCIIPFHPGSSDPRAPPQHLTS